ncbi:MAG TPA: PAS domain S-box protein [Rubrobacteraceae bacterium]|nr:PAS domain S-box protein [Rubrobacteraceae bacterium]
MGIPLRILIVEDSEDDTLLLLRQLRRGGYDLDHRRVDTASSMQAALDERTWDLVISDHSMPNFSSSAALELLQRNGLDLPFIIASGKIGEDVAVRAMKAGAHDYIMKDNMARLNTAIERELREAEERRERRRAQEALRVSETRFRLMVEQAMLAISTFSTDGRMLQTNRAGEELWGTTLKEVAERAPDYNVLEDEQLETQGILPYLRKGFGGEATAIPPTLYDPTQTTGSGRPRWVQSFIYPVKNFSGEILEVVLMQEDITERREAEEALQKSESSLAAAQRIVHIGNFDYSVEEDEARWSDELYRIFGYAPQRFIPTYKSFLNSIHPEDRRFVQRTIREALYAKKQVEIEYRIVRPDGEARIVHTLYEASFDEEGRPLWLSGTVQDITERREAEEERKRAEQNYRLIFENAVEGIFQSTVDGRFLTANPALARMLGYESPEELLAVTSNIGDQLYVEPERRKEFNELIREHGAVLGFEIQMRRKDGRVMWASVGARAVCDGDDNLLGYEGTVEDVTERKRAEVALREIREAERRRIARDLHDEAMQDLVFVIQSLQYAQLTSADRGSDDRLEQEVSALRRVVAGLRNAVYDLRLGSEDRSFLQSLEALVELNRQMAPERELNLNVQEGFPEEIDGNIGVELLRIFQEALVNIRRHSNASYAQITLGRKEDRIWVEIEDDGQGFEPGKGGGIGLTGMRERAHALAAELQIRSEPGKGTTLRFSAKLSNHQDFDNDSLEDENLVSSQPTE